MTTLEEDKINECKIIFDMFDEDKDSKIEIEKLPDCLRICGAAPNEEDLEMISQTFENQGDGLITFEKFLVLLEKFLNSQYSEEDLINELKKLDKLNNGTITEYDLRKLMSSYDNPLSSEEIEEIIQEANVDQSGYINIQRFAKLLLGNF